MCSRVFFPVFSAALFAAFFVVFFAATPFVVRAAAISWDGGGDGATWSDGDNWSTDTVPGAGDDVTISGTDTVDITADLGVTLGSLTLGDDTDDGSDSTVDVILNFKYDALNTGGSAEPLSITNALTVNGDAQITHDTNTTSNTYTINISAGSMTVDADNTGAGSDADKGGMIYVDAKGCQGASGANATGDGPDAANLCTASTAGYGEGANASNRGSEGAGHGGPGGDGVTYSSNGATYDSLTAPTLIGSSGGGTSSRAGGHGGGLIRINVSGTLTLNGILTADGSAGAGTTNQGAGGGSGGSIYITTATMDGSGSMTAAGGAGAAGSGFNGGGGGGGRIAVTYTDSGSAFTFSSSSLTAAAGASGGVGADAGGKGTIYVKDTTANSVTVFHGFYFDDTDYSDTNWTFDASIVGACESDAATPSVTATGTLTLDGTITCTSSSLTSFNFSAGTALSVASGTTIDLSGSQLAAGMDITMADGDDVTWTNVTISLPAEGILTVDDAVDIELAGTTALNTNVQFTNLTEFILGASASINADAKGCHGVTGTSDGYGPDGSNDCTISTAGYAEGTGGTSGGGGGGHGGAGGTGVGSNAGGTTYGSETAPVLLGSSGGGSTSNTGGYGGGLIYIQATNMTNSGGTLTADGGNGDNSGSNQSSGGGSGGSIYLSVGGTLEMESSSITAVGGNGATNSGFNSGSGGGGRVSIAYVTAEGAGTTSHLATLAASTVSAAGTGGAGGGADGTLSVAVSLVISSAVTSVTSGSSVDTLTLTFSAAADITDGVAGDGLDSVSLSASTGTCTVSNADYADTNTTTLVLTVSCTGDAANNTAITIDVTYDDTGNDVIEPTGGGTEIANGSATTGTDGAAPAIVSGTFYDATSSDGKLDLVTVVFSENISAVADASADWAISSSADFSSLVEGTVECNSGSAAANECDYNFTTATAKTDVGDLTLAYTAGTSLTDGTNNAGSLSLSSGSSPAFTDGAAPVISSFDYQDADEDGLVDRFNVLFSETVIGANSVLGEADLTFSNVGDFTDLDWGPDATDRLTSDVSSLLMVPGIESSASDTRDDSGNLAISTQSNFTLQDSAGNTNSTLGAQSQASFTDGAAPVYLSGSYTDDDDDGQVDLLSITFTETIGTNAASLGDFSFTANDITSADLSGGTNPGDTGSATITLTLGTDGAANITSHSTAPTLAYTFSSGDLQDASNNQVVNFTAQSLSDAAAPVIVSRTTLDNNLDGTVDYLKIVWSEALDDSTVAAGDFVTFINPACAPTCGGALTEAFSSGTPSSGTETDTGNDATIYVGVTDGAQTINANTTNIQFRITVSGTVDDSSGNTSAAEGSATLSDDGAAPVPVTSTFYDASSSDGKIDLITVVFSEDLSAAADASSDWAISSASNFSSLVEGTVECNSGSAGSNECDYNFTTSTVKTDVGDLTLTYTAGTSLSDGTNNTASLTFNSGSSPAFTDGAAPVPISYSYTEGGAADGKVDGGTIVFSEAMSVAGTVANATRFTFVSQTGANGFGGSLTGNASAFSSSIGIQFTGAEANETSALVAPTIAYDDNSNDAVNALQDASGNIVQSFGATAMSDLIAPYPVSATFYDASSSDGKLDLITVVFTEDLTAVADGSADWAISSASNFSSLVEGTVECNSGSAGSNECDYNFTTSTIKTDVGDLTLAYTAGASVSDGITGTGSLSFTSGSSPAFTDGAAPAAIDALISIAGGSGTGGAYKVGDTITVSWDNSATAGDVSSVTADLSGWGGSATATMTDTTACSGTASDNIYEACYTILGSEGIDTTGVNASVDATDAAANNRVGSDTTGATVDTVAPTVTAGNISVTGATGTSGAFKSGDTAVPTWDNTGSGDNNSDTLASVTINAANFASSDTALSASDASGTWTASLSGGLDSQDDTSNNITVTVVDNAGNSTSTAGTNNYVVDTIVPVITADNVTVTGCTGTGGACKNGDTLVLNWLGDTDGESDTIASVTFVATDFDTDSSSVSGSDPGTPGTNDWTGSLTGSLDSQDDTGNQITATVVDNAGNSTGPVTSTATYTVDTILPTLSSQVYQDSDTDGTVDRIVLTFSEDVSNGFSADKDEWTFPEVSEMNFVAPDDDSDVTNATTTVTVVIGSDAQETGHTTAPTVSYTSTDGTLQDDAGNAVANFSAQTLTDDAAPQTHATTTPNTIDNNDDGTVDFVQITFTESLSDASVAAADFKAYISTDDTGSLAESFTSTTPASGNYTDTANDAVIYIGVSSSSETISANTTDYRLYIQMIGSLEDATGNASSAEGSATQSNDLAQPRIVSSQTGDNDADGQIDRIVITFTEDLSDGSVDGSDFSIPGFTVSDASDASGTVTVTLVESGSPDTDATPPVSIFGNGLADASSGANLNDFLSSTPTDAAGPVWVSASPDNGETHIPAVNDFTITFSEPIDTGSFALSESPSLVAGSFSYAWDGTDETVTVSPGTYTMGTTITHTITAPDTTGNAYAGATYSLYPLMPSSSGGGGGGGGGGASTVSVTPDTVTLTAPNGSESLTGGETYDITWISSGNIDNVSLYYSVDGGATYASIVSGTDNDGSYAWRVPNTATTDGFVKIVGRDSGAATLATDTSDASHTIEVDPTIPLEGAPEVDESGTTSGSIDIVSDIPIVEVTLTDGTATMLLSGHLFRGETLTGVYLVDQDGRRRVFPSESVFFSYYQNFDDVLMVTDDQLRKLPVGRRVTMASGRMVKIQSNPNVYQVHDGGILRLVPDEATARALYGDAWNTLITDIAPTFWGDYTVGEALETS